MMLRAEVLLSIAFFVQPSSDLAPTAEVDLLLVEADELDQLKGENWFKAGKN